MNKSVGPRNFDMFIFCENDKSKRKNKLNITENVKKSLNSYQQKYI